jgi:5'-nucleotidase
MGMNRRSFVKISSLLAGGTLIGQNVLASPMKRSAQKLVILHTNDTHSNIDPFPSNHAKFPNMGGVSHRDAYIRQVRAENEHVLLLDSGDIFQGTPYFNRYKGTLEMKLMSAMGYDASTMGNHDFDAGLDGFKQASQYATFPFLCANYDFSETILTGLTRPYHIFQKGALQIGVFGIGVELEGLVPKDKFGSTRYVDPISVANQVASELHEKGCDLIICLSHLGFEHPNGKVSDKILATETEHIHLILGGHTHTLLGQPFVSQNKAGRTVVINQAGWAGLHIGRFDFDIPKKRFSKETMLKGVIPLKG